MSVHSVTADAAQPRQCVYIPRFHIKKRAPEGAFKVPTETGFRLLTARLHQ